MALFGKLLSGVRQALLLEKMRDYILDVDPVGIPGQVTSVISIPNSPEKGGDYPNS